MESINERLYFAIVSPFALAFALLVMLTGTELHSWFWPRTLGLGLLLLFVASAVSFGVLELILGGRHVSSPDMRAVIAGILSVGLMLFWVAYRIVDWARFRE